MNPTLVTVIGLVVVGVISGFVTWLVARRTTSGKIDTSEAAKLWDEGTLMRLELRDEVVTLKTQLREAIAAITELNREIKHSRAETEASREETRLSRAETRVLMTQIDNVQNEIKTSNALTLGALADNTETRRILLIPEEERSPVEKGHLDSAGERQPRTDRPDVPSDDEELPNA